MIQFSLFEDAKNVETEKDAKPFKLASMFSGCGGLDLGFVGGFSHFGREYPKNGIEIVFANDHDKDAVHVYKKNGHLLNHTEIIHDDIRNIDPSTVDDFDILTAGFPCQPFSNAGNRKGIDDHRGNLFEEVFRFISAKNPSIIIMENVKGILSSKMPDGTRVPDEIINRLKTVILDDGRKVNYSVSDALLLNAREFGAPQNRQRVIIIAVKEGLGIAPSILDLHHYIRPFEESDNLVQTVLTYPSSLPNVDDVWKLSPQQESMVPYIKRSWKDIPYEILAPRFQRIRDNMKRYHSPNFYRRFALNEVNGTITASAQPENCGIIHPLKDRRYNVREIARIQSFPDNFLFHGPTVPNMYKVIGNAVPPVMAYALAKWCVMTLRNTNHRNIL